MNLSTFNMNIDESIEMESIIDKLPSSWKDVKKNLKHHKDDLSLKDLGKHLLIEEQYRLENKANDDTCKDAVNRVFKYLKKTMEYGLKYNEDPSVLEVSQGSKKHSCLTDYSVATKFVALASCYKEVEWLRDLLINIPLWLKPMPPISMHCDSQSTLSRVYKGKSRHIGLRHTQVIQLINYGVITKFQALAKENGLSFSHIYILTKPYPEESENETLVESRERLKVGKDDFIYRGHILNAMSDPLFDVYQNYPTTREL
ncbi:hypothetical protein Tco_0435631 [Tanacetum coccineum]